MCMGVGGGTRPGDNVRFMTAMTVVYNTLYLPGITKYCHWMI